jgi:CxxC motif-containing protein
VEKNLVCINCPKGCKMVVIIGSNEVTVSGQGCKRGSEYAQQEAIKPLRVLTGNMKAEGCGKPFSVRTDKPIPKDMLLACAFELKRHHPSAPVLMGDIVINDILGTGVNVIATQDLVIRAD